MQSTLLETPSSSSIQGMFDRLAPRYDVFNRLTSLGLDNCWRDKALEQIRPGMRVLDVGCGTGDLSLAAARQLGASGQVVGLDFSEKMLELARARQKRAGLEASPLRFVWGKAEDLPLSEGSFDLVVSGFVLRNIYENIDRILLGIKDSLKDGGRVSLLDFTEPSNPLARWGWRFYMNSVVLLYGKIIFGKNYPMFYMADSAKRFLKPHEFTDKLRRAGFRDASFRLFLFGVIVLYQGTK